MYPAKDLMVTIINGEKAKGVGRCYKILVQVLELELQTRFFSVPLNEMEMGISVEWLI